MFLQRSEAAKAFHLVRESTRNNVATVFWATGTLDAAPIFIRIPVDSVMQSITFAFSTDTKGNQLTLTQPVGRLVSEGSPGAEVTELNCGRIITIASPEAGEWHAEITGRGQYWLEAQAQSDIHFISAEFVKEGGRPAHEGLFRIQGQPILGMPAMFQVSLSASATETTEFYFVTEEGKTIHKLHLRATNSDRDFLEFVGEVDLPDRPFRLAVMGRDSNGKPYQRFFSSLFHAESVEVFPRPNFDELAPGSTGKVEFVIRNVAFPRTFKITATDAHRFITDTEPKELSLQAGESRSVWVSLTVPAKIAQDLEDDLILIASSIDGPHTSNSGIVHLSVSSGRTQSSH